MIWGNVLGEVFLSKNEGNKTQYKFSKSIPLTSDGDAISSISGKSDPICVDWDGDGLVDLLVAEDDTNITFFKGKVSGSTDFEKGISLWSGKSLEDHTDLDNFEGNKKVDREALSLGHRLSIHVEDWNGDQKLDLILGNYYGNIFVFLRL